MARHAVVKSHRGKEPTAMTSFKEIEQQGWTRGAAAYDDWFAPTTRQAIGPLLDMLGARLDGQRLIDICCGTGHLAAAAAARGAEVLGIDFAPTMVEAARASYPALAFATGDAENLEHPDGSFDLASMAFGLLHLSEPERGLAEVCRVLKPGGRFAFAVWLPPDQGFDLMRIVGPAVREHGTRVDLPLAPSPFRFADPAEAAKALAGAGFGRVETRRHDCEWLGRDGRDLLAMIDRAFVRTPMLIEAQEPERRARIKQAIVDGAERFRQDGRIRLRFPCVVVAADKPA